MKSTDVLNLLMNNKLDILGSRSTGYVAVVKAFRLFLVSRGHFPQHFPGNQVKVFNYKEQVM